jgi:hypothetical protein
LGVGPTHAKDVKIIAPGSGHSLIVGGPGSTIIVRGKGHNLIVSHGKGATIILESPWDEVIANGPHDRIICAEHSSHELIKLDEDVKVSKRCHGHHDTIKRLGAGPSAASASATAHSSAIFGSGTNADPFRGNCDPGTLFTPVCITTFPARTLDFFWDREFVPAYECPGSHHWLLNQNFAPSGTALPPGVEVGGLGPIGVSITHTFGDMPDGIKAQGTETGAGNSDATNWKVPSGPASYQVILHCTDDPERGYNSY